MHLSDQTFNPRIRKGYDSLEKSDPLGFLATNQGHSALFHHLVELFAILESIGAKDYQII